MVWLETWLGYSVVFLGKTLDFCSSSLHIQGRIRNGYQKNCLGSLMSCRVGDWTGISCRGVAVILPVTSCYGSWNKLRLDGSLESRTK